MRVVHNLLYSFIHIVISAIFEFQYRHLSSQRLTFTDQKAPHCLSNGSRVRPSSSWCTGGAVPAVRPATESGKAVCRCDQDSKTALESCGFVYMCRKPWVCGISSLGIDHTSILGDTLEKIAWQKGGIFKPGVPAFTVKQQEAPMTVLQERAKDIGCPLSVCPELDQYQSSVSGPVRLGLAGLHQRSNASLALQLAHCWLQRRCSAAEAAVASAEGSGGLCAAPAFEPSPRMLRGLAETEWQGRNQCLTRSSITYFLDGAHTTRSMQACVSWFSEAAAQREASATGSVVRVLLFNATGERDCVAMLKLLLPCHFDFAVFCPNITETIAACNADQQNFNVSVENMLTRCLDNQRSWRVLHGQEEEPAAELLIGSGGLPLVAERRSATLVFPCILSALQWITQGRDSVLSDPSKHVAPVKASVAAKGALLQEAANIHVLITGSLHLVGGALKHLEPSLAS